MPSITYFLERSEQSIQSLQNLKFNSPGIFTNAIVSNPEITKLLKDPSPDENSLYRIKKVNDRDTRLDVSPERIDGRTSYVNRSFNEQMLRRKNEEKRTAVVIPKIIERNDPELELNSSPTRSQSNSSKGIHLIPETKNLGELCIKVLETIEKYPNLINSYDKLVTKLVQYKSEYDLLANEMEGLENEIQHQREQLNYLNINYSDLNSPVKSGSELTQQSQEDSSEKVDIDEYLKKEEQEIKELEDMLNKRQRLSLE
ncbi:uncharacterized protein PRCAT00003589001 [Priceomyces carsonii]|uniref:uncharacterized protein n=1 Tax=Priceomyces carsonii TaxID=28549 RepID=UPI002EDB621A|nr:unnamed protein product [Priceomyces carsonii]